MENESIRNEDGSLNMEEIGTMLKKLSAVLTLEGLAKRSLSALSLAQGLGILLATNDLGKEAMIQLAKDMQPASERIQEEMKKKNPKLHGLNSVKAGDLFTPEGGLNRDGVKLPD